MQNSWGLGFFGLWEVSVYCFRSWHNSGPYVGMLPCYVWGEDYGWELAETELQRGVEKNTSVDS